jgi:hypothetical protein
MDHYHPYKIQILQEPSNCDFVSRSAFCEQLVSLVKEHMTFRCLLKFNLNCLVVWINKTSRTEVKLILVSCISDHFTVGILTSGVFGPYSLYVQDGRAVTVTVTNMFIWWINSYSQGYTFDKPCHCLVPTRWSNSTYCSEVNGHS